jgi:hypothetical protein
MVVIGLLFIGFHKLTSSDTQHAVEPRHTHHDVPAHLLPKSVRIESDALITGTLEEIEWKLSLLDPSVGIVREHGWRCDTVSSFSAQRSPRLAALACNGFAYSYSLEDRGGQWVVSLE